MFDPLTILYTREYATPREVEGELYRLQELWGDENVEWVCIPAHGLLEPPSYWVGYSITTVYSEN